MILSSRRFAPHTYYRFDADGSRETSGGQYSHENAGSLKAVERATVKKAKQQAIEDPANPVTGNVSRVTP